MKKILSILLLLIVTTNLVALPGAEVKDIKCKAKPSFTERITMTLDFKFKNQDGFKFNYKSNIPMNLMEYTSSFFTKKKTTRFDKKAHLDPRFQDINIDYNKILLNSTSQIKVNMKTDK